jgi:hypothetical protein
MHPAAVTALRWIGSLIGLVLLVMFAVPQAVRDLRAGIQFNGDPQASEAADAAGGGGPVADGQAGPAADYGVTGTTAKESGARIVTVTQPGEHMVVAFERITGDPACLSRVQLEVQVLDATPTTLAVLPSATFEPAAVTDGGQVTLDPPVPSAPVLAVTDGTPGFLAWDVTGLYREYVTAPAVPATAPLVVTVGPSAPDPTQRLRFAASEAGPEDAPRLSWAGIPGCGAPGA